MSDCLSMKGAVLATVEESADHVQYWSKMLRAYAAVCDVVILTHLDGCHTAIERAQLEQILLTALPESVLTKRRDLAPLHGCLMGEFVS